MEGCFIRRFPVDLVVFDLDGTLVDSQEGIAWAVNSVLALEGFPPVEPRLVHELMGTPLEDIFRALLPAEAAHRASGCVPRYRRLFEREVLPRLRLFPDAAAVLGQLRAGGLALAVATGRLASTAEIILTGVGVRALFLAVVGVEHVERSKPDPAMLRRAMDLAQAHEARTLMVGDSVLDIAMGRAAGAFTCGVTYGAQSAETLRRAEPDLLLDRLADLPGRLEVGGWRLKVEGLRSNLQPPTSNPYDQHG
ncbi:MAG: HAD family hydrolase [Chloroflexi bacterium]|nr:HAD family hydrolase [Chloroflexota bacterium]